MGPSAKALDVTALAMARTVLASASKPLAIQPAWARTAVPTALVFSATPLA